MRFGKKAIDEDIEEADSFEASEFLHDIYGTLEEMRGAQFATDESILQALDKLVENSSKMLSIWERLERGTQ